MATKVKKKAPAKKATGKKRRTGSGKLTFKAVIATLKEQAVPVLAGVAGAVVAHGFQGGRPGIAGVAAQAATAAVVPLAGHMISKKHLPAKKASQAIVYGILGTFAIEGIVKAFPGTAKAIDAVDKMTAKLPGAMPPTAGVKGVGNARYSTATRPALPANWPSTDTISRNARINTPTNVRMRGVGEVVRFGPGARGASRNGVAQL